MSNPVVRIIRFHEYGPSYIISTLACGVVARFTVDTSILPVLGFVAFSSMFGFVLNDIADAELDRKAGKLRNPIAAGKLSKTKATILSAIMLTFALIITYPFSLLNKLLAFSVILLFATYSWGVRAKARPILDVAYHSSWPVLYGAMAYTIYSPLDLVGLGLAGMVFLLSLLAELVQEIRDYESDRAEIRTTVILVGKRTALKTCIIILLLVLSTFVTIILLGGLSWILLAYSPAIVVLITPFLNALHDERREKELIPILRSRGTVVGLLMLATYVVLKASGLG